MALRWLPIWIALLAGSAEFAAFEPAEGIRVAARIDARAFAWSPDGTLLAVGSADGIRLLRAPDFSELRVLTLEGWTGQHPVENIAWRPDGAMLAIEAQRPEDHWHSVWITDTRGASVRDIVGDRFPDPGARTVGTPGWWRPDGIIVSRYDSRWVDYSAVDLRTDEYSPACGFEVDGGERWTDGNRRVFLWGALGTFVAMQIDTISGEPRCMRIPGCREDAAYTYAYLDGPTDTAPILVARHECDGLQPIVRFGDPLFVLEDLHSEPQPFPLGTAPASWSPDGKRIASLIAEDSQDGDGAKVRLRVVDLESGSARSSDTLGHVPENFYFHAGTGELRPDWSPDGRALAIRTPSKELLLVELGRLGTRVVGQSGPRTGAASFQWSPDGRWLTVRYGTTIYVVDPELGRS